MGSFPLSNDKKKVWATVFVPRFLDAIMHGKVIHDNFFFFLQHLQDHDLLRSRNFATMAT